MSDRGRRSPLRIRPFLRALESVWAADPDQRFGQLVMNLTRDARGQFEDCWNWEDSEWLRRMERALTEAPDGTPTSTTTPEASPESASDSSPRDECVCAGGNTPC